jgi:hypothetical protein
MLEIKFIASRKISRLITPGPWQKQTLGFRSQGIAFHIHAFLLNQITRIDAGIIEIIGFQHIKIGHVIKILVDNRPVMLCGGNQDNRLVLKKIIMRIIFTYTDGLSR